MMLQIVVEVAGTASTSNFLVREISLDAAAVRLSVCLVSRSAMIAPSTRTSKSSARSDVGPWETGASRGHRSKQPPDNTTPQTCVHVGFLSLAPFPLIIPLPRSYPFNAESLPRNGPLLHYHPDMDTGHFFLT